MLQKSKSKRVHDYQMNFTRNVEGISVNKKEKVTSRNTEIIKGRTSSVKANI